MTEEKVKYEIIEFDELPLPNYDGKYRKLDVSLMKYITNRVRKTIEYKNLIEYLKKTLNINHCSFYKDYSMENGFTIELHHAPLTLYDYVETVCNYHFSLNKNDPYIIPWEIEEEVNKLHYEFKVGLIPLNSTAHKLVHSGALEIHPSMVNFNWKSFVNEYKDFLSEEVNNKILLFNEIAKTDPDEIPSVLKYKPVLINNLKFKSLGKFNIENLILEKLKEKMKKLT